MLNEYNGPSFLTSSVFGEVVWGFIRQSPKCNKTINPPNSWRAINQLLFVCAQAQPARNQDNCVLGFSEICLGTLAIDSVSLPHPNTADIQVTAI